MHPLLLLVLKLSWLWANCTQRRVSFLLHCYNGFCFHFHFSILEFFTFTFTFSVLSGKILSLFLVSWEEFGVFRKLWIARRNGRMPRAVGGLQGPMVGWNGIGLLAAPFQWLSFGISPVSCVFCISWLSFSFSRWRRWNRPFRIESSWVGGKDGEFVWAGGERGCCSQHCCSLPLQSGWGELWRLELKGPGEEGPVHLTC